MQTSYIIMIPQTTKKSAIVLFISVGMLFAWFALLYTWYIPRIAAFGCFDDCFNYAAGYFILQGKTLYTNIFFNHQPLMAFLSALIQHISRPINLFEFLLRHRQGMLFISFLTTIFLTFRFGASVLLFSFLFESTKFYFFGDRFLAEGLLVYPLVYLAGILFEQIHKKRINTIDMLLVPISLLAIIFLREPYIPAAIMIFLCIIGKARSRDVQIAMMLTVLLPAALFILLFQTNDYFFNVVTVNTQTILQDALSGQSLWERIAVSLGYPFLIFTIIKAPIVWIVIQATMIIFLSSLFLLFKKNKTKLTFTILVILMLANSRSTPVGSIYYGTFQLLPWWALLSFSASLNIKYIFDLHKKAALIFSSLVIILLIYYFSSPIVFWKEKINQHEEFITNYSQEHQYGNIARILSEEKATVFVDGWLELLYPLSKSSSSYKYSMYTSVMPLIKKYKLAKEEMFKKNPPDIYIGSCPNEDILDRQMPLESFEHYTNIHINNTKSCLFVKKTYLSSITTKQWEDSKTFLVNPPVVSL